MAGLKKKNFGSPTETRPFKDAKGHLELIETDKGMVGRATYEPGWHWSKHVKPIAGTDSCQVTHFGYMESGRLVVKMNDGEETNLEPGDYFEIKPGHDAWVVGEEPAVCLDWGGLEAYANPVNISGFAKA